MSQKPSADREELAISHARPYTASGATVFYDRGRCLHFAECVRGLPRQHAVDEPLADCRSRTGSRAEGGRCAARDALHAHGREAVRREACLYRIVRGLTASGPRYSRPRCARREEKRIG
jgi:hypothetical protein